MSVIIDIENPNEILRELRKIQTLMGYGFDALALDYGFYVKSTINHEERHQIYELRDNVRYRFKSSEFQYYLLLRHRHDISRRFAKMLEDNPEEFTGYHSGNPHFEMAADEIMSIYDSIIFHLSSAFDYLSMMVNYTFGSKPNSRMSWGSLVKSCADEKNNFSKFLFAEDVKEVDNKFVSKFNHYRAELIHRKSSNSYAQVTWTPSTGQVHAKFECCTNITKNFKTIIDNNEKYSLAFLSNILILEASQKIAQVLNGMRKEFAQNWSMAREIQERKIAAIVSIDEKSGYATSPSREYWNFFDDLWKHN